MGIKFSHFVNVHLKWNKKSYQDKSEDNQTSYLNDDIVSDITENKCGETVGPVGDEGMYRLEEKIIVMKEAKVSVRKLNNNMKINSYIEANNIHERYDDNLRCAYPIGFRQYFNEFDGYSYSITLHFDDESKFSLQLFVENFNINIKKMTPEDWEAWCIEFQQLNSINLYNNLLINYRNQSPLILRCIKNKYSVSIFISDRFLTKCSIWFRAMILKHRDKRLLYFAFISIKTAFMNARVSIRTLDEIKSTFVRRNK